MTSISSSEEFQSDDRSEGVVMTDYPHDHGPAPSTAIDPELLDLLERENRQLEFVFETGARALATAATAAASAAFSQCGADVERVTWIETLGVFPPLVQRGASDAVSERRVQWAREAFDLACASLRRQLDALARIDAGGRSHGADVGAARLALRYYLSVKREQIYPLYQDLVAAA